MRNEIASLKKTSQRTGWLYFIFALAAVYNVLYFHPKIIVSGNAAATANNMLANEFLFRTGMAVAVITHTLFVFVILSLYRLLKQVHPHHARVMAGLVMVAIPVAFLADVLKLSSLSIFKGDLLASMPLLQRQEIAMMLMKTGSVGSQMVTFYWGLWLVPLGLLVYRSGFMPRILGSLLIANGAGYIVSSLTFILFPEQLPTLIKFVFPLYFVGELPFIFWLMIVGTKDYISVTVFSEKETSFRPGVEKIKEPVQ